MATLAEKAGQVVAAYAAKTILTTDELLAELSSVYAELKNMEAGHAVEEVDKEVIEEVSESPAWKDYFRTNEIICMVCGETGFQTLLKHLSNAHGMPPKMYRNLYGIPRSQSLYVKNDSAPRRSNE